MFGKRKFQTFISSTYTDLIEERQAAVAAILKFGHIPAGMELFAAGDQSQMDVIKRWINESDIYVLIFGGRYGSLEKISSISYTELEYDYAISIGKPVFSIVMDDHWLNKRLKDDGMSVTEVEYPDKLKKFKEKIMCKMCAICADLKDIRGAIYDGILEIAQTRELAGWVPASLAVDATPLYSQIENLKNENDRLNFELDEYRSKSADLEVSSSNALELKTLQTILENIEFEIPAEITTYGNIIKRDALRLFRSNRNLFVKGWIISKSPGDKVKWFVDNLFPLLMVHGMLELELTQTGYKRYYLTQAGLDLLAWIDRQSLIDKPTPALETSSEKRAPKPRRSPKKGAK